MNDETFLNERIEVITVFGEGLNPCRPIRFRRPSGREIEITEIGLRHPSVKGHRTVHMFDVTDGGADYRLEFDSERLTWHLTMEDGETVRVKIHEVTPDRVVVFADDFGFGGDLNDSWVLEVPERGRLTR